MLTRMRKAGKIIDRTRHGPLVPAASGRVPPLRQYAINATTRRVGAGILNKAG